MAGGGQHWNCHQMAAEMIKNNAGEVHSYTEEARGEQRSGVGDMVRQVRIDVTLHHGRGHNWRRGSRGNGRFVCC